MPESNQEALMIGICPDPARPRECVPAKQLTDLFERDPDFFAKFRRECAGRNCHDISMLMVAGLWINGVRRGWEWVVGQTSEDAEDLLSWMECDGWVFDGSAIHPLFIESHLYYATANVKVLKRRSMYLAYSWFKDADLDKVDLLSN